MMDNSENGDWHMARKRQKDKQKAAGKNEGAGRESPGLYEVRWHGCGRTLMSRSYCRDRKGIQDYIDKVGERIKAWNDWTTETKGNSPDYFETISRNDQSGVSIRKVNEARKPYNMLVDKFKDVRFLHCCRFSAMLDDADLKAFSEQEQADIKNNCKLYSYL